MGGFGFMDTSVSGKGDTLMLKLHPPVHSVPENFWHTLLVGTVAAVFVWKTGQDMIQLFLSGSPVTGLEQGLLDGRGSPVQRWILSRAPGAHPLLWNRFYSFTGWVFSLTLILCILKKPSGLMGALPGWLLLFTLPGFSVWMSSSGAASWGCFFFLSAYTLVNEHEKKVPLIRGGVMAALAVLVHPVWILPSLGLLAGCLEAFRNRLKWVAGGFLAAGFAGGGLLLLLVPGDGNWLWAGASHASPAGISLYAFVNRYLLLVINVMLLLRYGAARRGLGWWSLAGSLPTLIVAPLLESGLEILLIPFWLFSVIGWVKLPFLLDVRFPRLYLSVLLCQLLLWLPAYLGTRPLFLYPPIP